MYLKQLEICGFKSFADKTRLTFEPGMIAIVGPNGCGKSNVSDAIRWVLGEQRPSALRCAKMQDIIFNGTDTRKPLGMAEVSLTFTDCEGVLDTAFNEVTITRRVFRSGEGQYFLNKNPCRLKDIHHLFMGTGVGTTSYSVMAQGQIDAILSSRPEDRRAVFEEAAGITKFKADRREAMRKIEQTEANLLRLSDVIREVKRQITTLQRQAERAEKYRTCHAELRTLELFRTRRHVAALEAAMIAHAERLTALQDDADRFQAAIETGETEQTDLRSALAAHDASAQTLQAQIADLASRFNRAREIIQANRQRTEECRQWAERDTAEARETADQLETLREAAASDAGRDAHFEKQREAAQAALDEARDRFALHEERIDAARNGLRRTRDRLLACEQIETRTAADLSTLETAALAARIEMERLREESAQIRLRRDECATALAAIENRLRAARETVENTKEALIAAEEDKADLAALLQDAQRAAARLHAETAALHARRDLLEERLATRANFSEAARTLLDAPPGDVVGTFASCLNATRQTQAVMAALNPWLHAVVVKDRAAADRVLQQVERRFPGASLQLLVQNAPAQPPQPGSLAASVETGPAFRALVDRLLGGFTAAGECAARTAAGDYACRAADENAASPLADRIQLESILESLLQKEAETRGAEARIETLHARIHALNSQWNALRRHLEEAQHQAAHTEGEHRAAQREAERAAERFTAVDDRLRSIENTAGDTTGRRDALLARRAANTAERENLLLETARLNEESGALESAFAAVSAQQAEARIRYATVIQEEETLKNRRDALLIRIRELERSLETRRQSIRSYDDRIRALANENETLEASLQPLSDAGEAVEAEWARVKTLRAETAAALEALENGLASTRRRLDALRDERGKTELAIGEARIRRQNHIERILAEYAVTEEALAAEPDPEWPAGEPPPDETLAERIAELAAAIQNLGPVNLVAIDEYKEHEARYTFLKAQEDDLLASKAQVLDLVRTINATSSERFRDTFNRANDNFSAMFSKLFHGGHARLLLLENMEDPLECGIDIVARPPGKKPQTISLLSGGERTMTAVSLLFAIFMIKPAPFCLLDELDAALDDSNIGRFVAALKDFLIHSQFLIITHNQHTIAGSDIVYGVTMPEKGVSKTLSMKLNREPA